MSELQFDPVEHKYTVNGVVLPSVTQVTQVLGGYEHIPAAVLEAKAAIGTHVHKVCELHDAGGVDESSIDPACIGYFEAYKKFQLENPLDILMNEERLHSDLYGFAGTLDRLCTFRNARKGFWLAGKPVLIDLKTVVTLMPQTAVQLAGYRILLPQIGVAKTAIARVALQLKVDGNYSLKSYTEAADEVTFLAALTLHKWKVKNVK